MSDVNFFRLPELSESRCISCNCKTWRTVCLKCQRGENRPALRPKGVDRRHNGKYLHEDQSLEDLDQ